MGGCLSKSPNQTQTGADQIQNQKQNHSGGVVYQEQKQFDDSAFSGSGHDEGRKSPMINYGTNLMPQVGPQIMITGATPQQSTVDLELLDRKPGSRIDLNIDEMDALGEDEEEEIYLNNQNDGMVISANQNTEDEDEDNRVYIKTPSNLFWCLDGNFLALINDKSRATIFSLRQKGEHVLFQTKENSLSLDIVGTLESGVCQGLPVKFTPTDPSTTQLWRISVETKETQDTEDDLFSVRTYADDKLALQVINNNRFSLMGFREDDDSQLFAIEIIE